MFAKCWCELKLRNKVCLMLQVLVNKHVVLRSSLDDLLPEFCEWYAFLQFKCKCHAITDASVAER